MKTTNVIVMLAQPSNKYIVKQMPRDELEERLQQTGFKYEYIGDTVCVLLPTNKTIELEVHTVQ